MPLLFSDYVHSLQRHRSTKQKRLNHLQHRTPQEMLLRLRRSTVVGYSTIERTKLPHIDTIFDLPVFAPYFQELSSISPVAMRFVRLFAASLAVITFDNAFSSPYVGDLDLKVMSFNLRTSIANDPCPSGCWEERKWRVKQLLERYEPDLIGTQEGAPDQIEFFQSQLSFASTGECAGDCQWNERNSIFYRLDRWELLETATFALSNTPAVLPSNTWGLEYLRAAVIARFRDKKINRVVCMLNTHFDIRLGHSQSAVLVAKQLSQRCQPEDTVLMTGDLNTGTQSSAVQYIIGQDPIDEGFTPIPMYETLTAASADGPTWIGSSFGNHVVGSKLDYIFSRRDNHTCLRNATILTDTFDGYSSSDHAVLLSKFCLGTECVSCIA
ncbi:unnamed protein product [Peronospora belbahrii]|uniref:Endonuclease/exonuclease/phosphatase domain-containing protein n=1 Tax=Peronospora belbahrii TaxID=622444 RepID=A0AAU9L124_9STRA|nr:unnamed protein product [Peronospora belbahrii]